MTTLRPCTFIVRGKIQDPKTNRWKPTSEAKTGDFHQWGVAFEEFETGPGNYSIAIIEDSEGNVYEVFPSDVKFLPLKTKVELSIFDRKSGDFTKL